MPTAMGQKPEGEGVKLISSPTPYAIVKESSYPETNTFPVRSPLELTYNSQRLSIRIKAMH